MNGRPGHVVFLNTDDAIDHLVEHLAYGHHLQSNTIEQIENDREMNDGVI